MGSRTIDFWLEFGDEFLVCAIEARWRFPQISTLICGCKNQQNIENQCFCLETQFRTKPCEQSRNGTCVWIRQGSRNRLGKYFPFQKEKSNGSGESSDRFYATVLAPQRPLSIEFPVFVEKYFLPRSLEIQEHFPHGTMTA